MKTNGTIWTAVLIVAMGAANLIWGDSLVEVMPGILNTAGEIAAAAVSLVGLAVTAWNEVRKIKSESVNWTAVPGARSVNWTAVPFWKRML